MERGSVAARSTAVLEMAHPRKETSLMSSARIVFALLAFGSGNNKGQIRVGLIVLLTPAIIRN